MLDCVGIVVPLLVPANDSSLQTGFGAHTASSSVGTGASLVRDGIIGTASRYGMDDPGI